MVVFSLLNDKGVIHILKPKTGMIGGRADGFGINLFHEQVAIRGLIGNPWLHHGPVQNTDLGRESRYFKGKTPAKK